MPRKPTNHPTASRDLITRTTLLLTPTFIYDLFYVSPSKKAVVVQWSAHPTWFPKLLFALPKNLILSLEGREVVGSIPTHGACRFSF